MQSKNASGGKTCIVAVIKNALLPSVQSGGLDFVKLFSGKENSPEPDTARQKRSNWISAARSPFMAQYVFQHPLKGKNGQRQDFVAPQKAD